MQCAAFSRFREMGSGSIVNPSIARGFRRTLLIGTALVAAGQARALDAVWSGSTSGDFATGGNWVGGTVPDGTAGFDGTATTRTVTGTTLGAGFGGFTFDSTSGPFSFSGVTGNFTGDGIVNNAASTHSLQVAPGGTLGFLNSASAGNAIIDATAAGSRLLFGGTSSGGTAAVALGGSSALDIASHASGISLGALNGTAGAQVSLGDNRLTLTGAASSFGGVISGNGSLELAPGSNLTLTGANTYTGGTILRSTSVGPTHVATLTIGDGIASGSIVGNVEMDSGSRLAFRNVGALTFAGAIQGSGVLAVESGRLVLTGDSHLGAAIISTGAHLTIGDGGANGLLAGQVASFIPLSIRNDGTLTYHRSDDQTLFANIDGGGTLRIASGSLTLTAEARTGGVQIDAGARLVVSSSPRISDGGLTGDVVNNGTLRFSSYYPQGYAGQISGSGGLEVGAGTLTLTGTNTYTGTTTIASEATLRLGNGGTSGTLPGVESCFLVNCSGTGRVVNDGQFVFNRSDTYQYHGSVSGAGSMIVETGTLRADSISQASIRIRPGAVLDVRGLAGSVVNDGLLTFSPYNDIRAGSSASFSGTMTGSGSVLVPAGISGFPGGVILNGATNLAGSLTLAPSQPIYGSVRPASTVVLFGTHAFAGGVSIPDQGQVIVGSRYFPAFRSDFGALLADVYLGGGTISFQNPGAQSFSRRISGTGNVQVGGEGLTGPNTNLVLTGDIALAGGRVTVGYDYRIPNSANYNRPSVLTALQIGDGGTSGSVSADILNFGTLAFNRSDAVTYGQEISGTGELRQIGTGTLTLSGTNTYTGATTVQSGTLNVAGSIASSSGVTVMSGATLSGTGVMPSVNVQSGGTFAPGNSVGTATVAGNLSLAAGSTTAIEMQGATADRINVTGTASLGGTLRLVPLGGSYAFNTPYTLIAAQGGRSGSFAEVSTQGSFGAGVTSELGYSANAVNLTLLPAQLTPLVAGGGSSSSSTAIPGNLAALIAALDAARASGQNLSAFFGAYNAPAAVLGTAFNQMTGEVATASNGMGLLAGQEFMSTMLSPFREGRDIVLGKRIRPDSSADGDDWFGTPPQRYAVWGQATGSYARLSGDGSAGSATRSARGAGFAMGFDMALGTQSMLGLAVAAGETSASLSGGLGSSRSWTGQFGVNGMTRLGAFTLQGAAALSLLDVESKRTLYFLGGDQLRADYGARVWSMRVEGRHDGLSRGALRLQPMVAIQAQVVQTDAYSERGGAAALRVDAATNSNVRTELGFQAEAVGQLAGRPARGFLRAAWAHYLLREGSASMSFLALPGTGFSAQGAQGDRDSAVLALGGEMELAPRWTLGARVDSELSDRLRSVAGTVRVRYTF